MTKKILSLLGVAAMVGATTGCSEEQTLEVGQGTLHVSAQINSNVVAVSRADAEEELYQTTKIWIYSDQGVVRKFNTLSEVPAAGVKLMSGTYTVKAWAGTLSYASFTDRWFEGQEVVEITADAPKSCTVECKIANVVASVKYPENVDELISNYSLTVSHKGGSLTFEGQTEQKGYFMMPEDVTTLDYVLNFTSDGKDKTVRGTIANVQPAHEYILNVKAAPKEEDNTGAAWLTIEVDDTTIDIAETIVITPAPEVSGYGFDISVPVAGEAGSIGRRSLYVAAASELKSVELGGLVQCGDLTDVDLVRATETVLAELAGYGISREITDVDGGQLMKIIFEDTFVNNLPNSDEAYVFTVKATDSGDKTGQGTFTLKISEAPVVTAPVADSETSFTRVQLVGTVAKDGIEAVGFEYAPKGTENWQYLSGSTSRSALVKGQAFYATLTGLDLGTEIQYRAVSGSAANPTEFKADVLTCRTKGSESAPQVANASFEGWSNHSDGAAMPMPSGQLGWDTGNHGSKTMGVQLTNSSTDMKHSGNFSAKLRSQFVGIGSIGKFAAGNAFYGTYIATDGTDGVIGFGRQFDFPKDEIKPTALRVWLNYRPAAVDKKGKGSHLAQGSTDVGHIFVTLFDGPDMGDSDSNNNGKYGFVVRTKNATRIFNADECDRVVAFGEKVLDGNYGPDGALQELIIPLDYRSDKFPTYMSIVFTASKFGDYFEGGEGSTMYIDDVEIVYSAK